REDDAPSLRDGYLAMLRIADAASLRDAGRPLRDRGSVRFAIRAYESPLRGLSRRSSLRELLGLAAKMGRGWSIV
ncbi:hypothetical protein, partial [Streptomyces sp. NBC_01754]|uniref:hypothetical protein n=1 Tax=Streptomyces sp. NBC_01754 TaxID=2975930 RepID=UPI002DD9074D